MTFVCYYECDRCKKRVAGDLTPAGWDFQGDADDTHFCSDCKRLVRTSLVQSESHGEKAKT